MWIIEVENLVKKFGDFEAVRGINLKIEEGEIFSLLGPNGAGKTTTISILTTILKPTKGKVIIAGYDISKNVKEIRKNIGVVFQDPSLDIELTAFENLYIHGKIYNYEGNLKERIEELLEFVDLLEFKDKQVKTFSGGMARRLEIARALLHKPKILFLDEPTIGLDPATRSKIWNYIKTINKEENITIFFTTHYMEEAEEFAKKVAIMDHGKIIAYGTPSELKKIVGNSLIYVKFDKEIEEIKFPFIEKCKKLDKNKFELSVKDVNKAIEKLFEFSKSNDVKIIELSYKLPTLNDVFIYLTGKELRDSMDGSLRKNILKKVKR